MPALATRCYLRAKAISFDSFIRILEIFWAGITFFPIFTASKETLLCF